MHQQTLTAHTNYGDFVGTVAADHHDLAALDHLAQKLGIDTGRYYVFGAHVHFDIENRDAKEAKLLVDILTVDARVVGIGFDSIKDYLRDNNGSLPYVTFQTGLAFDELVMAFKRFDLVMHINVGRITNADEQDSIDFK